MYCIRGDLDRAVACSRKAIENNESELGADHPNLADQRNRLAQYLCRQEKWSAAVEQFDRSRRVVRKHVVQVLPGLDERTQLIWLNDQEMWYHAALSVGLRRRDDAAAVASAAEYLLNGKGVVQEALVARMYRERQQANPNPPALWVSLAQVRRALPKDGVLVDIARFRDTDYDYVSANQLKFNSARYVAWIIPAAGEGDVRLVDLGEASKIEAAVAAVRRHLHAVQDPDPKKNPIKVQGEEQAEKDMKQELAALSRLLLEPLQAGIGERKQWLISPDGALWLVPWAALPVADDKYAIEAHSIRYLISGRDLLRPASAGKADHAVMMADPDYDLSLEKAVSAAQKLVDGYSADVRRTVDLKQPLSAARLPGTAAEAKLVKPLLAKYTSDDVWVYKEANALKPVFTALHSPRVLVLSTHGFFLEGGNGALENPLVRCGLLLAGCNRAKQPVGGDNGILFGLDIVTTDLTATELVVLSACETGLGDVRNGEGVAGLRQAFQLAGARSVIATLWQVPDRDTALLTAEFFDNLAKKQSNAEALQAAQVARIKARRDRGGAAHPFFWAAFTITGN